MRWVEGGEFFFVISAVETDYISVDYHSSATCGVVGIAFPVGAYGDVLSRAATYDTHGSSIGCCPEVELYSLAATNGKGDITTHIKLRAHVATRSSGYIGIVFIVLYFPVLGDSVRLVCGKDDSVI